MKNGRIAHRLQHELLGLGDEQARCVRKANVMSSMWPASMLAKSRTASENGRKTMLERNSMTPTSGCMRHRHAGRPRHAR